MDATTVHLTGVIDADGKLTLDGDPGLPAGPVRVTLQAVPADFDPTKTEIWQFFKQMHARRRASGERMRTAEEIDADLAERARLEDEYEQDMERLRNDPLLKSNRSEEVRDP